MQVKEILRYAVLTGIFAVPFIVFIVASSFFFPYITGKNFAFRIIVEITFMAWVLLALYEPQYRPRFSWILAGFVALIGVMFFADLFGQYPLKSFWSNFERMAGYVTLVHVFLYFIIVGSVMRTEQLWNRFFNTTLVAAVLLSGYAFAQLAGETAISQSSWRLDGTLGNSTYMAVYMLFHIFIAAFMAVRSEVVWKRFLYGALCALFLFIIFHTGTRGTILGFTGGVLVTVGYIALFAKSYPGARKFAVGVLAVLLLAVGAFITLRDSSFVQSSPALKRVANISLSEGSVRFMIWDMAIQGIKERPILGWGQENFNYVFGKYYNPQLYNAEPWYDRVHNIVLDWLIAGGLLGALAYFSILFAALYYVVIVPLRKRGDTSFTVVERGVLLGLLAAYTFHNLFVFDNVVSYLFYAVILGFIHSRVSTTIATVQEKKIRRQTIDQVVLPASLVVLLVVIYLVNVPGIRAATGIIDAYKAKTPDEQLTMFENVIGYNSFANQEIREQMTLRMLQLLNNAQVSKDEQQKIYEHTEAQLLQQATEKPGDARVESFIAIFYRGVHNDDKALEHLAIARKLAPDKQQIIFEQGIAYINKKEYEKAFGYFKDAYELAPEYSLARIYYAIVGLYVGKPELVTELIQTDDMWQEFAKNSLGLQAAYVTHSYALMQRLAEIQIQIDPTNVQYRINLTIAYYEAGDKIKATQTLEQAIKDMPQYTDQITKFIEQIKTDTLPKAP